MDISTLHQNFLASSGVCTDSRKISAGCIFFALKGERFNANVFAVKALELGAALAIVDEKPQSDDTRIVLVDDVLRCLQQLANFHRKQLKAKIIAICGSNGKTSTKELTYRVLASHFNTYATPGNFNNHIGVPLSLLQINDSHDFAVIEMGANHKGEHDLLCTIAEPDMGLITNNGKDHLEGFGSIEGVIEANIELYYYLRNEKKPAFVNADDKVLMQFSEDLARQLYAVQTDQPVDCKITIIEKFPSLKVELICSKETKVIETELFGSFHAYNIGAAACVGFHLGVPMDKIADAIKGYRPANMRTQRMEWQGNHVILDAYNANPSSMEAVLYDFKAMANSTKAVILGDMFELGEASYAEHKALIESLNNAGFAMVVLIGKIFYQFNGLHCFTYFETVEQANQWLKEMNFSGLTILIKGSRGMALETLLTNA